MSRHGHRFALTNQLEIGMTLPLPDQVSRQIRSVLRLDAGDHIRLFNGDGFEYAAEISEACRSRVTVRVTKRAPGVQPFDPPLAVGLALIKHDRFEWALQKLTELGVDRVIPLTTERTVLSFRADRAAQRFARWQRIVTEAAEQSGRATLPEIEAVADMADVLGRHADARTLILWEDERTTALPQVLDDRPTLLLVGPEGGFSAPEVDLARKMGCQAASLGPFTLRAETAAVAAASMVLAGRLNQQSR